MYTYDQIISLHERDKSQVCKILKNIIRGKIKDGSRIKIMLLPNWTSTYQLSLIWNKMTPNNSGVWDNIQIVYENPDFYVAINQEPRNIPPERVIYIQMEPYNCFEGSNIFFLNLTHANTHNNIEWHLSYSYDELENMAVYKNNFPKYTLSTILSDKYNDPGQKKRIDFARYLDGKEDINLHVFGARGQWKNYKGALPYQEKENGLIPYKYTFNAENNSIKNYFTEKLTDSILSECISFYWGCPNISDYIDSRCYVNLSLQNFEEDYQLIKKTIDCDMYEFNLVHLRTMKEKVLNELQFFPRVKNLINQKLFE